MIVLLLACTPPPPPPPGVPSPPVSETADSGPVPVDRPVNDVLVLLTDDQGTDKVAVYAEHPFPPPTPNIDALAARGRLFRNTYAFPVCSPGRAAVLTGRMPRRTGVGEVIQSWMDLQLPLSEVVLPELLATADPPWASAALGKWHLAGLESRAPLDHPTAQGFGSFAGTIGNLYDTWTPTHTPSYYDWEKVTDGVVSEESRYATTVTVDDALERIATLPEPWLVYVGFHAPHEPFDPPPAELCPTFGAIPPTAPPVVRYHAMVEALDTEIGRLLGSIDPDVLARTTVIFLSDNGTPGAAVLPPLEPGRAKVTMYEGGIRVPMIVAGPLVDQPGTETDALVEVVDVFSTVAEIGGVAVGRDVDGVSLLPLLADPDADWPRTIAHSERFKPVGPPPYNIDMRTSGDDRYKVIEVENTGLVGVFDISDGLDDGDPLDLSTLNDADRARVDALLAAHAAYWDALGH